MGDDSRASIRHGGDTIRCVVLESEAPDQIAHLVWEFGKDAELLAGVKLDHVR